MFRKLSILVPTRKRPAHLRALLDSYAETCADPSVAELVFRIDVDDYESKAILAERPWTTLIGPRYDGYRSLPRFFDEMRHAATGDVFLTGNDDMVFRTPGWASRVLEVANQYPDGVFCLGVDTLNAGNFPFAIVSRRWAETVGHIHDARLFWGDVYLRDIAAHFGRAIRVPGVQIDHCWMGFAPDQTFLEAGQGAFACWDERYTALHQQCVGEAIGKLEAACLIAQ